MSYERQRLLPRGITTEQVEATRKTFQSYYAGPLTDDDCIEMILNVYGLCDVFDEIDQRLAREAAARED